MSYQYLFCATCSQRRTGHGFRCSVCNSLLRRPEPRRTTSLRRLEPLVRATTEQKIPIAA
jgi:hypothetical protein